VTEICEALEYASLTYQIAVEVKKTGTGRTEARLFEGGDLAELVGRVKRYIGTHPKGNNLSIHARARVTNTFALDPKLIEDMLGRPRHPPETSVQLPPEKVGIQERAHAPSLFENVLLNPKEVSELIGVANKTLTHWRTEGRGPKYVIVGARSVRYWREDLMKWIAERNS